MNKKSVLPNIGRGVFMAALLLLLSNISYSQQTIWTGAVDSDWNNPSNWGQGLPSEGGSAVVPTNVFNSPVISGTLFLKYTIENFNSITIDADAVICNEGYFVNYSNGSITNEGKLINKGTILFDNDGVFENDGTFENRGSFDNGGPNSTAVFNNNENGSFLGRSGSILINTGNFNNRGYLLIEANSFVYHYFKFTNLGEIDNLGTFENFECAEFINDTDFYVGGDFWNLGTLFLLSGDVHAMTMNGGVVLTDLADAPKPVANCQDITVSLGDNGMYTIDPLSIDNASNGPCFIANYEVTPAKLNCDNVGTTTVTLKVTDYKGYSSTCEAQVTVNPSSFCENDGTYCSFTQGFYGNYGGKQFGQTTAEIILAALSNPDGSNNPITIGGGDRTIVLNQTAVDCIIEYMPAGGKPEALPMVNVNLDDQCDVSGLPTKNNNFRNVLLGQTIALSLNVRYDVQLGGLQLSEVCGADFGLNRILPNNPTIGDILVLANKALAGEINDNYISKINNAATFINEHFDECQKACGNQGRTAILDLMASPKGLSVDLTFISETNGDIISFEIEKSLDGENFQTINEIQNVVIAQGIRSFDAVDSEFLEGTAYYRVKRNRQDGSFDYSPIRWVDLRYTGEEIRVFPNPVSEGNLNISLNRFKGQDVTIQLINSLGTVVRTVQIDQADQDLVNMDLSEYIDGYYKLFVIPQNNKAVEETVIIQRF